MQINNHNIMSSCLFFNTEYTLARTIVHSFVFNIKAINLKQTFAVIKRFLVNDVALIVLIVALGLTLVMISC